MAFSARSAPTLCGSSTSSAIGHSAAPCPATSGSTLKYLLASTDRLCSARGTTVPMITALTSASVEAFELEQLVEPHRIFVGGAARVGGDPPARADLPVIDQREDDIGVAGIDGEQHGSRP